ncbi:hypothetical protein G9A89_023459 [Geosiphon pyriformis]|nr:hypothetical protein G9A89_023459 [Geosiphon pyriformis]
MNSILADFSIVPVGTKVNTSEYIAEVQKILKEKQGIKFNLHASGTNLEGNWHDVMDVIQQCIEHIHKMNVPRVCTSIRIDSRTDKAMSIEDSIRNVNLTPKA